MMWWSVPWPIANDDRTIGGNVRQTNSQNSFIPWIVNHAHEEPTPSWTRCASRVHRTLGLTVTEAAKRLGVTRQALNNLVNGKGGISAEMAVRFSKTFGSSPEVWLGMQMEYDLAQVEKQAHNIKVKGVA